MLTPGVWRGIHPGSGGGYAVAMGRGLKPANVALGKRIASLKRSRSKITIVILERGITDPRREQD